MKLKQLFVTAIATAGLTFAAQAAPASYGGVADQASSRVILVGGHGGGGHGGGGHFGGGRHFGGGSHFSAPRFGGGHFSAPRFGGGHYGARHLGGGHWRGHGHRRGGYYYYGWGGGSCYGNCLAAGYSSSYCAVHSYDFCW